MYSVGVYFVLKKRVAIQPTKLITFKQIEKSGDTIQHVKVFPTANNTADIAPNEIYNNSLHFLLEVYKAPKIFHILRYSTFVKLTKLNNGLQLPSLLPTSANVQKHFYRKY